MAIVMFYVGEMGPDMPLMTTDKYSLFYGAVVLVGGSGSGIIIIICKLSSC